MREWLLAKVRDWYILGIGLILVCSGLTLRRGIVRKSVLPISPLAQMASRGHRQPPKLQFRGRQIVRSPYRRPPAPHSLQRRHRRIASRSHRHPLLLSPLLPHRASNLPHRLPTTMQLPRGLQGSHKMSDRHPPLTQPRRPPHPAKRRSVGRFGNQPARNVYGTTIRFIILTQFSSRTIV
jgi:hypothetical protein